MSFFTVSTSADSIRDYSGNGTSKFINKSGIYEIILKRIIVDTSAKGSQTISLFFSYNDQDQVIYNAIRLTNNDGSPNLGANMFNKLLVVLGATADDEIADPVPMQLPIGKGGENKECMVLDQDGLVDVPVLMRVQMEYSMYEGRIMERKNVRNFFRYEDKATASEIINNADAGQQYEKEMEYAEKVTYKDDLTEEDVNNWIKGGRNKSSDDSPKKPSTGFGTRRTFGKK